MSKADWHPTFALDRPGFMADLTGYCSYEGLCDALKAELLPRPSTQPPGYRKAIIQAIREGRPAVEGARAWVAQEHAEELRLRELAWEMGVR